MERVWMTADVRQIRLRCVLDWTRLDVVQVRNPEYIPGQENHGSRHTARDLLWIGDRRTTWGTYWD